LSERAASTERASGIPRWRVVDALLVLIFAAVASSYAVLAMAHVDDRYRVDFVSGTWLALADYVTRGMLYPPFYADGYLGGTRYMPLPVLLDGGAAKLGGDLLVSTKLVTYVVAAALCALTYVVLRQVECPRPLALGLVAAVIVTPTGLVGTLGLRNDGLAVAFQLAAVAVVLRRRTTTLVAVAGVLAALAVLSKASAVWAAAAIALWLAIHARSYLRPFLVALGGFLAASIGLLELLTSGRFLTNVTTFTFTGRSGPFDAVTDGVQAVVTTMAAQADAVWLLFPFAAVAVILGLSQRRPTLLQLALIVCLCVLSVVMSSRGIDHNHLLDLCVLTVLVAGEFAANTARARNPLLLLTLAAALIWGVFSSYQRAMGPQTLGALKELVRGDPNPLLDRHPLAGLVEPSHSLLSEDPTIPLELGQRPVLLDSFIARVIFTERPETARAVARRVAAKEFDEIILVAGLEPGTGLYDKQFLGRVVNDAVRANYRLAYAEPDLYVYLPAK
jgi:hypothetical protein